MVDIPVLIEKSTKEVKTVLERAENDRREIVKRCQDYLETARLAVLGLWNVFDQILVNAENCDLKEPDEIKQLRKDIDSYANVDSLRPELRKSIRGLRKRCEELAPKAARGFQLPKVKRRRENTVEDLEKVIEDLDALLEKLETEGLQCLKAGSGIGIIDLSSILSLLDKYKFQQDAVNSSSLQLLVEEIRQKRLKDELWETTDKIVDVSEDLNIAFKGLL